MRYPFFLPTYVLNIECDMDIIDREYLLDLTISLTL